MKKLFSLLIGTALVFSFYGCKDDEVNLESPTFTVPDATSLQVGASSDVTFAYVAPAGFKSSSVAATGGTATIKTDGVAGAASGNIVVGFTAGNTAGAGSITLSVTDNENDVNSATAVLTITLTPVPTVTAPPASTVPAGTDADVSFAFTAAAGGFKSSTVTATGGTAVIKTNGTADATSGNIVVTFTAGATSGPASVTLTVTDKADKTGSSTASLIVGDPIFEVNANITANATWKTGSTYVLGGRIAVVSGVTLTIEPGVVVKGKAGTGANATALLIARGGKIDAQGTAALPIIFTSVADDISPANIAAGEFQSPNLDPDASGLWGGLLVLGKAPISVSTNATEFQIEGIPASDTNGLYGGNDPADNSGVIKYVSIRHSGTNIGEGNEINGLTLGGVGSGTVIEYVEVVGNQDDGIEFFGGTVNVSHLLIWNTEDDGVDTDQAWSGTLDNFVVIAGSITDHTLEIDGPEGTFGEGTSTGHIIKNGSIKGFVGAAGAGTEMGDFRDGARATISNIYFFNFPDASNAAGRGDLALSGAETIANFGGAFLTFSGLQAVQVGAVPLTTVFKNGTDAHATYVTPGTKTVGADLTKFNWTFAKQNGALADF